MVFNVFVRGRTFKAEAIAMLKEYAQSIKYYDKALAIEPNHVGALNGKRDAQ
jgi:hypothetical protein